MGHVRAGSVGLPCASCWWGEWGQGAQWTAGALWLAAYEPVVCPSTILAALSMARSQVG